MYNGFTPQPLSKNYQHTFESLSQEKISPLLLSQVRSSGIVHLFKTLRNLSPPRWYIFIEEASTLLLLPALMILSMFTKAAQIEIVYPDFKRKRVKKWQVLKALLGLSQATVSGLLSLWRAHILMNKFLSSPFPSFAWKKNKNFLYLNTNLWFGVKAGGSVGHIAGVINGFSKQNFKVHYLSCTEKNSIDSSVTYYSLHPATYFSVPFELNYFRFNHAVMKQAKHYLKNNSPDFIYQRLSIGNYSGILLSRYFKTPLVIEYNGSEVWISRHWGNKPCRYEKLMEKIEMACLKNAQFIVTISSALRDELLQRGIPAEKIICHPNGVDIEMFNPDRFIALDKKTLRKKLGLPDDSLIITFIGTFGQWHGVDMLARAIRQLIDQYSSWLQQHQIKFMLIGDGKHMSTVKALLNQPQDRQYVILTGLIPQQEAPVYLALSEIFVSPHIPNPDGSPFFGSPTKLFEYMAMGKAVIASNLGQIGEILKNSLPASSLNNQFPTDNSAETGVTYEPIRLPELVKAIIFLVENPVWRMRLGKNARDEVLKQYTWNHHVQHILNHLYKDA